MTRKCACGYTAFLSRNTHENQDSNDAQGECKQKKMGECATANARRVKKEGRRDMIRGARGQERSTSASQFFPFAFILFTR